MTPHEEAAFEAKAEKMLAGHRQAPNGRNVFAFVMRNLNNNGYYANYNESFPKSTALGSNLDKEYCPECDKKKVWCECKK